jgi:hypothetical protein
MLEPLKQSITKDFTEVYLDQQVIDLRSKNRIFRRKRSRGAFEVSALLGATP